MFRCLAAHTVMLCIAMYGNIPAFSVDKKCYKKVLKVAIDIGHSKRDPGAISARGIPEYVFNQRFASEFVKHNTKHKKLKLIIINESGKPIRLRDRTRIAAQNNADIFLSFHHDSVNRKYLNKWVYKGEKRNYSDKFQGFSLFVSSKNQRFSKSFELAKLIGNNFVAKGFEPTLHHAEPIKGENRKLLQKNLGIYDVPFAVLRTATMPSVLIELGIILNRKEETLLNMPSYREKLIANITQALEKFCPL
ncbi:MAG: N-acetylmuramoyl-L-alanine amidase family protein [Methyloligellaceae bacterium]